jgi:hypothetical protein
MSVAEIESIIEQLPAKDFAELVAWIQDRHSQSWDEQIECDLDAGRLDAIMAEADAEYQQGLAKPL